MKQLLIILAFFCAISSGFAQKKIFKQEKYPFDTKLLEHYYDSDSIFQGKIMLDRNIKKAEKAGNQKHLAILSNAIAILYEKAGSYKIAEEYYLKSLNYLVQLNDSLKIDLLRSKLLNIYVKGRMHKQFDSLYPIAQKLAYHLQTENIYRNKYNRAKELFNRANFKELIKFSENVLQEIKARPVKKLRLSRDIIYIDFEEMIVYELRFFNAFALSQFNDTKAEGYLRMHSINADSFEAHLNKDPAERYLYYHKLSYLFYYKGLYFAEKKQYDSAIHYLKKSDTNNIKTIEYYEKRMAVNGNTLYNTAKSEEKLYYSNQLIQKDKKLSKIYLTLLIICFIGLIALSVWVVYFYRIKKKIALINERLSASNKLLIAADIERKEFFALVSHELRTPVYGINGLIDIIEAETETKKKQDHFYSLKLTSQYISLLIDNILQVTRFSTEDRKLHLAPIDISIPLQNIITTAKVFTREKNIELELKFVKTNPSETLLLDRMVLNQILINLIFNAAKFSPANTKIIVNVDEVNRTAHDVILAFEVIDQGRGINYNEETLDFVVYNAKKNKKDDESGTRLGLQIVQDLLKVHDSILYFKTELRKGTHFKFSIRLDIESNHLSPEPVEVNFDVENMNKNILVVDDNAINLMVTRKNLENIGNITVTTINNGKDAIELVRNTLYDLILMDINMPEIDGFQTTEQIKKQSPNIPVVALTALNYNDVIQRSKEVGMVNVITKPYNILEFKKIIASYL